MIRNEIIINKRCIEIILFENLIHTVIVAEFLYIKLFFYSFKISSTFLSELYCNNKDVYLIVGYLFNGEKNNI